MDIEIKMDGKIHMPPWISPKIQRSNCSHNFRTTWCLFPYLLKMQK